MNPIASILAFAIGCFAARQYLKRRHTAEVESWTDPLRDCVRQRDQLQRDYQRLQRFHSDLVEQAREQELELNAYREESEKRLWN